MQERWWERDNRELIKRYFNVFRPYRKSNRPLVYRTALGMTITTIVSLVLPWITMKAVDHIINTKEIKTLGYLLMVWIAAILARAVGSYFSFYHLMIFRQRMAVTGKIKLMKHILRLPISYFNNSNIGYIVCRVRDDVSSLQVFWAGTHLTIVQSIIFILVSLVLLVTISPKLTLAMIVLAPLYLLHSFTWLKTIRNLSYEARELSGIAEGKLHESFSGAATIKSLCLEAHTTLKYFQRVKKVIRTTVRLEVISHIKGNLGNTFRSLVPIILFCYAGYLMYQTQLSVGEFIGFSVYVSFLLNPLSSLFDVNTQVQRALAPLQRVFEILDMKTESLPIVDSKVVHPKIEGDIVFENVSFSYNGSKLALSDLSVHIEKKSTVGVCGTSGAGKSTFVNLLIGLYAPLSGLICFDGIDAKSIPVARIRQCVGIVSQDTFLFNASVFENLTCGSRYFTKQQVERAARLAEAHEFISAMPDGYNTTVGVRGLKLSGGERARLSIARAILRDPSILVFDEATAFMDSETEKFFREATQKLFRDRTIIIIAHRISSISEADTILVFDGGRVIQQGSHGDLVGTPGLYRRLCQEQMKENGLSENSDRVATGK